MQNPRSTDIQPKMWSSKNWDRLTHLSMSSESPACQRNLDWTRQHGGRHPSLLGEAHLVSPAVHIRIHHQLWLRFFEPLGFRWCAVLETRSLAPQPASR